MILYHGSNTAVVKPLISMSRRALDFGEGFYLTSDFEQAEKWARRVTNVRKDGSATVSVFETVDELWNKLNILRFETPDINWLRTVVGFRTGQNPTSGFDVLTGPVANDRTADVISLFIDGTLTEQTAIMLLEPMNLKDQWTLKNENAVSALRPKESVVL